MPKPTRPLLWKVLLALGLTLALAGSSALWLRATGGGHQSTGGEDPPPTAPLAAASTGPARIAQLQQRLRRFPKDWGGWASLGFAYVQQARISADPTWYPKADGALRRSLALRQDGNVEGLTAMGALATARHDFAGALAWGERARAANPWNAGVYGVIGDALVELGRYPEAFTALGRMVELRPDLSSYARASYAWELQGRTGNAVAAMRLALQAASSPSDAAWASYYLGELYWNSGRLRQADTSYREGVRHDPSFVPNREGLAKVAAARGQIRQAILGYKWVVARYPLPQYLIELGDLYAASGQPALAEQQYELVRAEERLLRANGVNVDLDIALLEADHGRDPAAAVAAARSEWNHRHSVQVADALAWSLHMAGDDRAALGYSRQALRLGTRSALFHFHKGMIERSLGQRAAARSDLEAAIAINPHFSALWASTAAKALAEVGGAA
jgi:tetratricopeptide (TPR) repeat protein